MVVTPWSDLAPLKEVVFNGRVYGKKKTGARRKANRKLRRPRASSSPFKKREAKKRELSLVLGRC
jgi:hypothetical protein